MCTKMWVHIIHSKIGYILEKKTVMWGLAHQCARGLGAAVQTTSTAVQGLLPLGPVHGLSTPLHVVAWNIILKHKYDCATPLLYILP